MWNRNTSERVVLVLLILCILPAVFLRGATTDARNLGQFPAIQATSLDNAKLHLPKDFSGQLNLVVICFAREQQQEVDTWISAARQLHAAHRNFSYYELPTTSREDLLYRWWFDAALRTDTADKDMRSRILTAYVSKHNFHKTLDINNEKRVVAVLVDQSGKVYWRAEGSCTEEAKLALQSTLAANGV